MLLLDTCTLIWWLAQEEKIPSTARSHIAEDTEVCVSVVTTWEILVKHTSGKLVVESGSDSVFDYLLSQIDVFAPSMPRMPEIEPANAPEPYSAEAWAYTPNVSEYEPQAEGSSFLANEEPEEEPEPAPAPRKYNDYGEIREWEPEPEPEMEDIPTVSRFMGQSNSDEISLDDLLDEIIKAGE